jgi:hypothetical protein
VNSEDWAILIPVIEKAIEVALPAVLQAVEDFRNSYDREPTAEEIRTLVVGLKPPEEY